MRFFSDKSRRELEKACWEFPWDEPRRLVAVTLTYPKYFPTDDKLVKRQVAMLRRRFAREYGEKARGIWGLEFQERGAPHFHLFLFMPLRVEYEDFEWWGLKAWSEVVRWDEWENPAKDYPDPKRRALMIETSWSHAVRMHLRFHVSNPWFAIEEGGDVVGSYLFRHSGKWAQKVVPEGYENMGHFWGVWGAGERRPEVGLCCERTSLGMRRVMRRYWRSKVAGRVYGSKKFRGTSAGMTLMVPHAEAMWERLHRWSVMECERGCAWYENDEFDAYRATAESAEAYG